jgi:hypothetical protein
MSRRPSRRRKPSAPKPNVSVSLEPLESRYFPNDLIALLGGVLAGTGLSVLGASAAPRIRDSRDAEGTLTFVSSASRTTEAASPAILTPASPPAYEPRPSNDVQVQTAAPTTSPSTGSEDALTSGLGDPLRYDAQQGGPPVRGIQLPDAPPTGSGSFGIAPRTNSEPPGAAAGPTTPAAYGNYGSPAVTSPGSSPVAPANPSTPSSTSSSTLGSQGSGKSGGIDPDGCGTMGGNGCGGGGGCIRPIITGISPDTGYSSSDQITNAQNLTLYGTAAPNASVTLFLANQQFEGTTADASGNWSYDYTWNTLPQGTYLFIAENICNMPPGDAPLQQISELLVTVDLTPPSVSLTVPSWTTSLTPTVNVNVSDNVGLPPNDTVNIVNTDTNQIVGSGTLPSNGGYAQIQISVPSTGTYHLEATTTDLAGNVGDSAIETMQVVAGSGGGAAAAGAAALAKAGR